MCPVEEGTGCRDMRPVSGRRHALVHALASPQRLITTSKVGEKRGDRPRRPLGHPNCVTVTTWNQSPLGRDHPESGNWRPDAGDTRSD